MDVEVLNPFVNEVFAAFESMAGIKPTREAPYVKDNARTQGDITGVISFTEEKLNGSIALSFPIETALKLYNAMMGENATKLNREIQDLIGELTNIIASGVKKAFSEKDISFHVSVPTIIVGRDLSIKQQLNIPVIVVPFKLQNDSFLMEVNLKINK